MKSKATHSQLNASTFRKLEAITSHSGRTHHQIGDRQHSFMWELGRMAGGGMLEVRLQD